MTHPTSLRELQTRFDRFADSIAPALSNHADDLGTMSFADSKAEALHALTLIADRLPPGGRVLEVGAGLGLVSAFLATEGLEVVALEPGGGGFDSHLGLIAQVFEHVNPAPRLITEVAERLNPDVHGYFDFIFSVNVLEHVTDLPGVMTGLASVLASGGTMRHSCPNYHVPYEPHFGVPLVPFAPRQTARILGASTTETKIWRSLNFITTSDVVRLAAEVDCEVQFVAAMGDAFRRLTTDEALKARHPALARIAGPLLSARIDRLLDTLPAALCTPMVFDMQRRCSS